MKVAVTKITIGYTRDQGFLIYNTDTYEFLEYSTSEVIRMLKKGGEGVCGLKLVNGKIELDEEGFNQENMMIKSSMSMGKYRPMKPNGKLEGGRLYSVVRAVDTENGLVYEVVSNTCARFIISEEGVRKMYEEGVLAGLWINSENDQITLADSIPIIDMEKRDGGVLNEGGEISDGEYCDHSDSGTDLPADGVSAATADTDSEQAVFEPAPVVEENGEKPDNFFDSITTSSDLTSTTEEDTEDLFSSLQSMSFDESFDKDTQTLNINEMSQVGAGYRMVESTAEENIERITQCDTYTVETGIEAPKEVEETVSQDDVSAMKVEIGADTNSTTTNKNKNKSSGSGKVKASKSSKKSSSNKSKKAKK